MPTVLSQEAQKFFEESEKRIEKIQPKQNGLIKNPDEGDHNFWSTLGDMALSAPQGVVNAVEEQGDFLDENIVSLGGLEFGDKDGKFSLKDLIPKYVSPSKWKSEEYSKKRQLPSFHKPETLAGNVTEGATRFITGFIGPSKILKGVGLAGGFTKTALRGVTAGAVTDLTVFDPNEGRLSDMLVEFDSPVLNNAVTQYLATDEDDTEMEGRLKNVLEGMLIGGPLEILMGVKAFKKAKATKNIDEKQSIYENAGKVINDIKKGKKTKRVKEAILDGNQAIDVKKAVKTFKTSAEGAKKDTELFISKILNVKSFKNASQVLKSIDDVVDTLDDNVKNFLENDVLKNETAEELAKILSRDKDEVLSALARDAEGSKQAAVRMLATKQVIQEMADQYQKTLAKYLKDFGEDDKLWSASAKQEVGLLGAVIRDSVVALKEQIRGAARVTQAGKIKVARSEGKVLDVEKMADIVNRFQGSPAVIAKKIKDAPLEEVIDAVAKTKYQRTVEVFNSLYINSLLSGVFTHAINMKSGIYEALIRPLEQIGGGVARADYKSIRLGFAQYQGMMLHFGDTIRAVGLALKNGDAILDPLSRTQDNLEIVGGKAIRPISGANLGFNGSTGTAIDWIGRVIELPSRLLMTGDELLKQMNYRGRLYTNALENTMERGLSITSKEGRENIEKIFKEGFDKNGMANVKDNGINADALQYARESTYTNTLKGGSYLDWGAKIQSFLNNAPEFRFLAPFIRTPTNLWRHFGNRVPGFGLLTKQNRMLWNSGDRRARAEVLGRQFMGMAYAGYGLHLATEDIEDNQGKRFPKITGNGPKDFNVKKTWLSMGWQPYSIAQKNNDGTITYKQYNRMDPRFYIFGIIADLKENLYNINDEQKEDFFTAAALTVFRNASNKTYLRGISDAADLISNTTENKLSKFFGGVVGNAIPYSSLRGQGIPGIMEPEKELYETRGFLDQIIQRSGFGSGNLDPRRDILTGEPIERVPNALYTNPNGVASLSFWLQAPSLVGKKVDVKNDPVAFEIARLKVPLTEPQKVKYKTVDLTKFEKNGQSAYDYLLEQIGKSTNARGETLKQRLGRQFESSSYQRLQEGDVNYDGGKEYQIRKIFGQYKDIAYIKMLKEFPEVKDAIINARKQKASLLKRKTGDEPTNEEILLPR